MLVTRIIGDCPKCGDKNRFGNVSINGNEVLRGCMSCSFQTSVPLPKIRKKILYLDQYFFSSAFREHDERFVEAAKLITQLSESQLLVAPYSSVHEDETHQWRGYDGKNRDELMEFIKTTSRGHRFNPYYIVERTQVVRAFNSFLDDKPIEFVLDEQDVFYADVHNWDNYFRIDFPRYYGDIELIRNLKDITTEGLVGVFPSWRESTNDFDEDVVHEFQTAAGIYIEYIKHMNLV